MLKNIAKHQLSIIILIIIHAIGIIGLVSPLQPLFIKLTPLHLLVSALILILNHKNFTRHNLYYFFVLAFAGYLIEVLGVNSKIIFGQYNYGKGLGFKMAEVPLIIGINWLILIYCTAILAKNIPGKWFRITASALFMVIIDFAIEPVAVKLDYWTWQNDVIPVQNYIAWFVVSFLFHRFFQQKIGIPQNKVAFGLYFIQFLFFITLGFLL